MAITATTTSTTKPITTTSRGLRLALFAGGALLLAGLSVANLAASMTPVARGNQDIADTLPRLLPLPFAAKLPRLLDLKATQMALLAQEPAEPFAWARLAYLRVATGESMAAALDALRMAVLVSPHEPRQLPERAVLWRFLRSAETPEEQARQPARWAQAYEMERDQTWALAVQNRLDDEVGIALAAQNADLAAEWQEREKAKTAP